MAAVAGLFKSAEPANVAVTALTAAGFTQDQINVMAQDVVVKEHVSGVALNAADAATSAARGGAVVGGLGGLLIGLGIIAIPGLGPILATGSLAAAIGSTVAGAGLGMATGGVLGALVGMGVPEAAAEVYAEGVKRGGVLIVVNAPAGREAEAHQILTANGAVDADATKTDWAAQGWKGFDPALEPTTTYPRL